MGRLDILAIDSSSRFVVIELKSGKADSSVLSQILPYLGWIKNNNELNPQSEKIRGIVVAHDFDEKTVVAASALPSLKLKRYRLNFDFEDMKT